MLHTFTVKVSSLCSRSMQQNKQ